MKIFVAHSTSYDFENELYKPLRDSKLNLEHEIFLPQESRRQEIITIDVIKASDVVVAEVSYPSTGQGIELGWANIFNIPVICIKKQGMTPSQSLKKLTDVFVEYKDSEDMIRKLTIELNKLPKKLRRTVLHQP